jgi:hypothetical protein
MRLGAAANAGVTSVTEAIAAARVALMAKAHRAAFLCNLDIDSIGNLEYPPRKISLALCFNRRARHEVTSSPP